MLENLYQLNPVFKEVCKKAGGKLGGDSYELSCKLENAEIKARPNYIKIKTAGGDITLNYTASSIQRFDFEKGNITIEAEEKDKIILSQSGIISFNSPHYILEGGILPR